MSKVILFNFSGTIVNTKYLAIHIFNNIAETRGYKKINAEDIETLSSLLLRKRCKRLGVPIHEIPVLGKTIKQRYQQYIPHLEAVDGIVELVEELKQKGFRLGLLTSNSRFATKQFLINNSIDIFDYSYYADNSCSKAKNISAFLKQHHLNHKNVIYIGDEIRDIQATNKNCLSCIAAAWGYDSFKLLAGRTELIARTPNEILNIVSSL